MPNRHVSWLTKQFIVYYTKSTTECGAEQWQWDMESGGRHEDMFHGHVTPLHQSKVIHLSCEFYKV